MAGYLIEIVPYDASWPAAYEHERERLASAIGQDVLRFEHMGSTSVPGLDSKPIIDISAALPDLSLLPAMIAAVASLGYSPIAQRSQDRFDLWRMCEKGYPSHILHFMQDGSEAWMRPIIFRNALRADPALRAEYGDLKRRLADSCMDDIEKYGTGKTEFVKRVVEQMLRTTS